jgi:hypothetical protein
MSRLVITQLKTETSRVLFTREQSYNIQPLLSSLCHVINFKKFTYLNDIPTIKFSFNKRKELS